MTEPRKPKPKGRQNIPVWRDARHPLTARLHDAGDMCETWMHKLRASDHARLKFNALSVHCHRMAIALDADPTLNTEPSCSSRLRGPDLFFELLRQLETLIPRAVREDDTNTEGRWWQEAEKIYIRATDLAEQIATNIPRADHATEQGSHDISEERLAARCDDFQCAVDLIRSAVAPALRVAHVSPRANTLLALADEVEQHAAALRDRVLAGAGAGLQAHGGPTEQEVDELQSRLLTAIDDPAFQARIPDWKTPADLARIGIEAMINRKDQE